MVIKMGEKPKTNRTFLEFIEDGYEVCDVCLKEPSKHTTKRGGFLQDAHGQIVIEDICMKCVSPLITENEIIEKAIKETRKATAQEITKRMWDWYVPAKMPYETAMAFERMHIAIKRKFGV